MSFTSIYKQCYCCLMFCLVEKKKKEKDHCKKYVHDFYVKYIIQVLFHKGLSRHVCCKLMHRSKVSTISYHYRVNLLILLFFVQHFILNMFQNICIGFFHLVKEPYTTRCQYKQNIANRTFLILSILLYYYLFQKYKLKVFSSHMDLFVQSKMSQSSNTY